jgi:hypothetical protein
MFRMFRRLSLALAASLFLAVTLSRMFGYVLRLSPRDMRHPMNMSAQS